MADDKSCAEANVTTSLWAVPAAAAVLLLQATSNSNSKDSDNSKFLMID